MLRIAQIGSIWHKTPPDGYGGTERIQHLLTEGLVKKGHKVTLFATEDSQTKAKLISIIKKPLTQINYPWTNISYPLLHITQAFDREAEFDIVHMHLSKSNDYVSLPLAVPISNKVVFTLHFPYPLSQGRTDRHQVFQKYRNLNFVSISNAARYRGENLNWLATVYNGVPINEFTYNPKPKDYFVWVGKFNPDKGTKEAIMAAKKAGVKLILAGKIDPLEKEDYQYYLRKVKPYIDGRQIIFIGEVTGKKKNQVFGNARGFLNPINWNEPFGLVMTEAMATGTPVISYKKGAASELIENRKTGFLVDTLSDMIKTIKQVNLIDRAACRQRVEKLFSAEKMVKGYEKVYQQLYDYSQKPKRVS